MLQKVEQTIRDRRLMVRGDRVLVGCSGGADSIALLHVLHYLAPRHGVILQVAHLNHRLRGGAADDDARFVQHAAWRLGLPCHVETCDVAARAAKAGVSVEMAAREARRAFFTRVLCETGADVLALGHTADDQAETVLLRVIRGTSLHGLGGIAYRSEMGGIVTVRPLRDISHAQAVLFLQAHGLDWREDASNADKAFQRNRVRHEILPMIERTLNPRVREAIVRMSDLARDENAWLTELAGELLQSCRLTDGGLDVARLNREPPAARRRILMQWLSESGADMAGLTSEVLLRIERLANDSSGTKRTPVGHDLWAVRTYDRLALRHGGPMPPEAFCWRLPVPGDLVLPGPLVRVEVRTSEGWRRETAGGVGECPAVGYLSAAKVGADSLIVRSWNTGDRMEPLGLSGSKKLQDVFVDAKVPTTRRPLVPVFECRGEIVWIPGYRVARGWEVKGPAERSLRIFVEALE